VNAPAHTSPYGKLEGLPARFDALAQRLRKDRSFPWLGTGIIQDIDLMRKYLNLREYGEFLRTKGGGELGPLGDEILEACDAVDEKERLEEHIDEALGVATGETYDAALGRARDQAVTLEAIRETLVETGALAEDDSEADLAALLAMLLS